MEVHIIVKLKSSYESWKEAFDNHAEYRAKMCDERKTLVGKANETTALITVFDVDMEAMNTMMEDPNFQKLTEPFVEEHIPYTITPLSRPN